MYLLVFAIYVFVINLPFGWWRARTRKFSPAWFTAVHAAVPLIIAARLFTGYEWHWAQLPVLVLAYFGGQFTGARLGRSAASDN